MTIDPTNDIERLEEAWASVDPDGKMVKFKQWLKDRMILATVPSDREARNLVDSFYTIQETRLRIQGRRRALKKLGEPGHTMEWLAEQNEQLEKFIVPMLGAYVADHKMGEWLFGVYGIGPITAAGLLALIDINKCPTYGHIYQFFGIAGDGQRLWEKGKKRPYCAAGKMLCRRIGENFVKFSNRPECYFGALYRERKAYEVANNDAGRLSAQAVREASKAGRDTEKWGWNNACFPAGTTAAALAISDNDKRAAFLKGVRGEPGSGQAMLHLGHINDRARLWAVKQFLGVFHGAWYRVEFGAEPPKPYAVEHLGHAHIRDAAD